MFLQLQILIIIFLPLSNAPLGNVIEEESSQILSKTPNIPLKILFLNFKKFTGCKINYKVYLVILEHFLRLISLRLGNSYLQSISITWSFTLALSRSISLIFFRILKFSNKFFMTFIFESPNRLELGVSISKPLISIVSNLEKTFKQEEKFEIPAGLRF